MRVRAVVSNSRGQHEVTVATNEVTQTLQIPPKPTGFGSGVNGGEFLLLAVAT